MIDLHCHLLPDVDDGSEDLDMSLRMAWDAWNNGTKIIVATPHYNRPDEMGEFSVQELKKIHRDFCRALADSGCPLRVLPGMELFVTPDLPELLDAGEVIPLGSSKYLLIEFRFDERLSFMSRSIQDVLRAGYSPVVAHPERYRAVQRQPGVLGEWFSDGAVIQLNKGSILGELGRREEDTAWWALERGLAHAVASDAHFDRFRTPDLSELREVLEDELDPDYARLLLRGNPARILQNREIAKTLDEGNE